MYIGFCVFYVGGVEAFGNLFFCRPHSDFTPRVIETRPFLAVDPLASVVTLLGDEDSSPDVGTTAADAFFFLTLPLFHKPYNNINGV